MRAVCIIAPLVLALACGESGGTDSTTLSMSQDAGSEGSGDGGSGSSGGATSGEAGTSGGDAGSASGGMPVTMPDSGALPATIFDEPCGAPMGECQLVACDPRLELGAHGVACEALEYNSNPPTSGTHYGIWAQYKVYDQPVPRGFYLHSMEHSAVVLVYNCAYVEANGDDCDALVKELTDFAANALVDPLCLQTDSVNRIIVTPDPLLDAPFAAAAWGHYIKGNCFDEDLVTAFTDAYYGMNYENFCEGGIEAVPGGAGFPEQCEP